MILMSWTDGQVVRSNLVICHFGFVNLTFFSDFDRHCKPMVQRHTWGQNTYPYEAKTNTCLKAKKKRHSSLLLEEAVLTELSLH